MRSTIAAIKIQRAWRKSETLHSISRKLNSEFLEKMKTDNHDSVDTYFILQERTLVIFRNWLYKHLLRGGEGDFQAVEAALNSKVMVCWFVVVHKDLWDGTDLLDSAEELVAHLLDLHDNEYGSIRELGNDVRDFLQKYAEWQDSPAYHTFVRNLRESVILMVYHTVRNRITSDATMFRIRRLTTLYALVDPSARNFQDSVVYQSIRIASRNEFWSPAISQARILHELVLDPNYTVALSDSIPNISVKHKTDGRIVDSPELRNDVMSSMLCAVDQADMLEEISNAFHSTKNKDSLIFTQTVIPLIQEMVRDTPVERQIRECWESRVHGAPLDAFVHCVRLLRNFLDNAAVQYVRLHLNQFIYGEVMTPAAMSILQARTTVRTMKWIESLLMSCSREMVSALSAGNPFVLLEFFDTSLMNLVLKDTADVDFLSEDNLPEVVRFDRDRLVDIRLDLSTCVFEPEHFMEFIIAKKWIGPPSNFTPTVRQAAERLRPVLLFSRFCHGHMVCGQVIGAASRLLEEA